MSDSIIDEYIDVFSRLKHLIDKHDSICCTAERISNSSDNVGSLAFVEERDHQSNIAYDETITYAEWNALMDLPDLLDQWHSTRELAVQLWEQIPPEKQAGLRQPNDVFD